MGLIVTVYKDPHGDFTNGGESAGVDDILVVNADGPFTPDAYPKYKRFLLVAGNLPGTLKLVPATDVCGTWMEVTAADKAGPMFGGNYAACSDSRFGELAERILGRRFYGAVAIHDRYETWAEYDALSR